MCLISETLETDNYKIERLQNLKDKVILISLSNNRLVWYCDNLTTCIHPILRERNISVNLYLEIICFLSANAFANGFYANSIYDKRASLACALKPQHQLKSLRPL